MNTSEGITYELLIRSALRYEVKINVPADQTADSIIQAIYELGKDAEIPGFRKGRASPEGVRAHYGESRGREVAADILAHDAFAEIVGSLKNKPVTPPEFELSEFRPGEDYTFKASYYVQPPGYGPLAEETAEKILSGHGPQGQTSPGLPENQNLGPDLYEQPQNDLPVANPGAKFIQDPTPKPPLTIQPVETAPSQTPEIIDPLGPFTHDIKFTEPLEKDDEEGRKGE